MRFEQRVEVKSRIDALIGRTVFEAKRDLVREWADVERKMPDSSQSGAGDRRAVRRHRVGRSALASARRKGDALVKIKETMLDPDKPGDFISWLDGALALKVSLPPDPTTVRIELGANSVAFRAAGTARPVMGHLQPDPGSSQATALGAASQNCLRPRH